MRHRVLPFAIALLAACRGGDSKPAKTAAPPSDAMGMAGMEPGPKLPDGHAEIEIPEDRQQLIGLELATVEKTTGGGAVRASATLQADEKRQAHVHTKLMGYVRELFVNAVGQKVKKGQALYTIYSQDLLVAEQEYLRARKLNPDLAAASRERLRLWDIPEDQIAKLDETGKPLEAITVRSPISGTVISKEIVKGHYVDPDMTLYVIADLSKVWVIADVYEYELGRVDRKGTAQIRIEGIEEPLSAPIDYVYPTVDPATRTVKVRLVVANPTGTLRPGNFATVELPAATTELLTMPDEAVIDTGTHQLVYVALGAGRFRPVEVEIGTRAGGRAEVRAGLAEGDQVVVRAQFLVDSESRLRAASGGNAHGGM